MLSDLVLYLRSARDLEELEEMKAFLDIPCLERLP